MKQMTQAAVERAMIPHSLPRKTAKRISEWKNLLIRLESILRAAKEGRKKHLNECDRYACIDGPVSGDVVASPTDMNLLLNARVANEIKHGAQSSDDRRSNGPP